MMAREIMRGVPVDRAREKIARYGRMVEPQRRFFAALGGRFPGWVVDVETCGLESSVAAIRRVAERPVNALEAFDFIKQWLTENVA
jgi:hypothetical protein